MSLADKKCVPCRGGIPPLAPEKAGEMLRELGGGWQLTQASSRLEKAYPFKNFADAMLFANRVGDVAEAEGHHPDLHVAWGHVRIEIWTHKIGGLSESDFYLAAKSDRAFEELSAGRG
ncbi:MAG: 4a-hydroxytetrahydrobiopterin dehydratase [Elusimicrobia bacterium RIFCSPLOWO2_12_FULL_59_9]|nr:MAG: 4a-hydroxytetrahydrobiopterin dehydratase [Elusimicrobia bacterium RIFCSPLOWO2_12_FULL_59_9]